jgi:hypothetical protein
VGPTSTPWPEGWSARAALSRSSAARGSTVQIGLTVKYGETSSALVDLEIYGPNGRVFQEVFDNQSFSDNSRSYNISWPVPANLITGRYTVKIGIFSAGWGLLYYWDEDAGTISIN